MNASLTILILISAYCYYFVTEKTGRGIKIKSRRVTYLHGTIYFPQLQEACDRQRTCKGQYVVLGPRKSAMPLVRDLSENDKIFRREKKYVE